MVETRSRMSWMVMLRNRRVELEKDQTYLIRCIRRQAINCSRSRRRSRYRGARKRRKSIRIKRSHWRRCFLISRRMTRRSAGSLEITRLSPRIRSRSTSSRLWRRWRARNSQLPWSNMLARAAVKSIGNWAGNPRGATRRYISRRQH